MTHPARIRITNLLLRLCPACLVLAMSAYTQAAPQEPPSLNIEWHKLPPLPDREGFAGMFAGIVSDRLVVAGGANFPEGYPWEGGRKYWYDTIYVLETKSSPNWKKLTLKLPRPLAYGVSWTVQNRLICAGGETGPSPGEKTATSPECVASVFAIEYKIDEFQISPLPSLPEPAKDACGAALGQHLIHFGGIAGNKSIAASKSMFVLNLHDQNPTWVEYSNFPAAPRVQAVATVQNGRFMLVSGIEITAYQAGKPSRKMPYLKDAWEYQPGPDFSEGKWKQLKNMPVERAAAPGPAWSLPNNMVAITGGVESARHKWPQKDHPGWSREIWFYNPELDQWHATANAIPEKAPVVTAASARWGDDYVIISGEIAPGRRSPAVWRLSVSKPLETN